MNYSKKEGPAPTKTDEKVKSPKMSQSNIQSARLTEAQVGGGSILTNILVEDKQII